jgi:hypothetical protein
MRSEEIHLVPQLATASTDAFSNIINAHASVAPVSHIRLSRIGPSTNSQLDSLSVGGQLNIRFPCGLRLYHILQLSSVLLEHNPGLPLRVPGFSRTQLRSASVFSSVLVLTQPQLLPQLGLWLSPASLAINSGFATTVSTTTISVSKPTNVGTSHSFSLIGCSSLQLIDSAIRHSNTVFS